MNNLKQKKQIFDTVLTFSNWANSVNYKSYDWWDIWSTSFGGWMKTTYMKSNFLGKLLIIPFISLDLFCPKIRGFFSKKRPFSICYAQIGLGYVDLFEITSNHKYLERAVDLVAPLLSVASKQKNGLGWGIDLKWRSFDKFIPPNTPCITQTAYVYEFFKKIWEVTENKCYLHYLEIIAKHVAYDYPEWWIDDALACSYFSNDHKSNIAVVNANSYRAMVLIDAGKTFENKDYLEKGMAGLRFVLLMQKEDGSWPYSSEQKFVDHYHTCFILKNLYKISELIDDKTEIKNSINRGLDFYHNHLFDKNGYPKPFAVKPGFVLHKYDSYDLAESIFLLAEMNGDQDMIFHLCQFALDKFKTKHGWFIFRLYPFPHKKGIPYIRYANSAMFLALTRVLKLGGFEYESAN